MDRTLERYVGMAKAYHDKVAEEYDKPIYNEVLGWDELHSYITEKIEWHYVEKYLPNKGLILDAAGGTGRLAMPIAKKGLDVVLIDISKGMLKVAEEKIRRHSLENRITLKQGDIHKIDYPENYFDFAIAQGIEYCPNLEKVVSELARVLKPNCYLEVSVDSLFFVIWSFLNMKDIDGALTTLDERKYTTDGSVYCWTYAPNQLRQICEKSNLKVEKIVSGGGICAYIKDKDYRRKIFQNKELRERLLEIELKLCKIEDTAILGSHPIIIAKKS
jgi:ubiquinone/menaquinone biosynthesis C-methylase UbiE